jgi:hypothetical protein
VELFFKWIKQHLRIKAFYGTSENAVKTPIWITVSVYVPRGHCPQAIGNRGQILQILSVMLFEKTHFTGLPSTDSPQRFIDQQQSIDSI